MLKKRLAAKLRRKSRADKRKLKVPLSQRSLLAKRRSEGKFIITFSIEVYA